MRKDDNPVTGTIKVIHVDDQRIMREGINLLLQGQQDIELVGQAATHHGLLEALRLTNADVVVIDLNLHGIHAASENGLTSCTYISNHFPRVRIVILTASEKTMNLHAAFANGAHAYVLKSTKFDELVVAIKTAYHGGTYICSRMQTKLDQQV
jgi:two-component system NarL family response regulator